MSEDTAVETLSKRFFGVTPVRLLLGLAVLGAIMAVLVLLDRGSDSEYGPLDSLSPEIGEPAPQFVLRSPDGDLVRLSDFAGQPVWLNFWATWCGPCRRELPDIQRLATEFEDDDLVVLAVNLGESSDTATDFWDELGLELTILLDSNEDVAIQYRRVGLPNNFFIDREGVLQGFQLGFLTEGKMREKLADIGLS